MEGHIKQTRKGELPNVLWTVSIMTLRMLLGMNKEKYIRPIHNSYKKEDIAKIENLLLPNN